MCKSMILWEHTENKKFNDKLIRDDANWRKRQFNTVDLFFNLYELEVLNTYRMLLGLCIELRCIV